MGLLRLPPVSVALWVGVRPLPVWCGFWPWTLWGAREGEGADSEIAKNRSISQNKQTEEKEEGEGEREKVGAGDRGPGGCEGRCTRRNHPLLTGGNRRLWALDHIYLFNHLFIYSFIHLFIYSFIHLLIYSFIHLFIYSCIYLFYLFTYIHLSKIINIYTYMDIWCTTI